MTEEEKVKEQDKIKMKILSEQAMKEKKEEQIEQDKQIMQEKARQATQEIKKEEELNMLLGEEEYCNDNNQNNNSNISSKPPKKNKRDKKNIIIITLLSLIIVFSILFIIISLTRKPKTNKSSFIKDEVQKKGVNNLTDQQKKFIGISTEEEKKEETIELTDEYKEYLKLPEEEKEKLEVIPRKEVVPIETLDEIKEDINIEEKIPEKFNLKDKINIKVENQGFFGLCWDFASMKSLETFLSLNQKKDYDFSEIHVDYLMSDLFYGNRSVHDGGSFEAFERYLELTGPILETTLPYKDYEDYKEFNKYKEVLRVTKTVNYPRIGKEDEDYDIKISEFRKIIKNHIMKNGSLYAVIDAEKMKTTSGVTTQYCSTECMSNHAISIVGWDDNYPKEKFKDENGNHPSKNGAYIALNSWGEEFSENGYFYISYEDDDVEKQMSGILSVSTNDALKIDDIQNKKIRDYILKKYDNLSFTINGKKYLSDIVLKDITDLDLSGLGLTEKDLKDLEKFSNLSMIDLSNNNIKNIDTLLNIKGLWMLDLSYNNINNVDNLTKIEDLSTIKLSHNNISDIGSLSKLKNISDIDISNNNITSINLTEFKNLGEIDLSDNPINWENSLGENDNIYELKISNTNLKNLSSLKNLKNISDLDISNNPIESLEGIDEFELYSLDISNINLNSVQNIDKISVRFVYANNCNIDDISIFNGTNMAYLELKNNNITDISNIGITSLEGIDLSNNNIQNGIESLNNLQSVVLSNNNITNLDEVSKLTEVSDLDISNNPINSYEKLKNLNNLYSLSLENNDNIDLKYIPENIEVLNIKNTNINDISEIYNFKNIWLINLTGHLDEISIDMLCQNLKDDVWISIVLDSMDYKTYDDLSKNDKISLDLENVIYNYDSNSSNIELNYGDGLNKLLLNNYFYLSFEDITIDKECLNIRIIGNNPKLSSYVNIVFKEKNA